MKIASGLGLDPILSS